MLDAIRDLRKSYDANPNATVTQMWYGFALLGVADYETISQVGLPEHRMLALDALGRVDEAFDVLETHPLGPVWGSGYAGDLAYAYLQIGDEQTFSKLLELMRTDLDAEAAEGADNWVVRYGEAQHAALSGDVEGALNAMQVALDGGFRQAGGFDSPIFSNLKDEPKFDELIQTLAGFVDAERGKLGLPPYQPVSLVDKSKKGSAWQP